MESAMDEREDGRSASLVPRQSGGEAAIRIIRLPSLSFQHESKQKPQPCEVCGDFDEKAFDKPRKTELHRLLGSSRAGCASCLLTCHIIDLQWHALAREQGEQLGRLPSDILERLDALNKELHRYPHVVELRMSVTGYLSVKTHSKYRFEGHHYCLTYIFAGPGDSNAWPIIKPDTNTYPDVDAAASFVKTWKRKSADAGPQPLPSRVLEIHGPYNTRLYEPTTEDLGQYACLSYCWGKDPHKQLRTTRSNIAQHKKNIDWAALPLTFQDALQLTRKLGMKYLWIDSLCIVQDDKADWRHEGGKMATIYSNSYITFAATNSNSAHGGLFNRNPTGDICEVHRGDSVFNIRVQHAAEALTPFRSSMALTERAWFFQERVLSPQIVHFATNELFWEDSKTVACECFGPFNLVTPGLRKYHLKPHQLIITRPRTEWWQNVVEAYTDLHLTFESDIFPALQGIAQIVQQQRDCAYYAGLWEDSLVGDMLWYCPRPCIRPQNFRAPTWSWASVNGQVTYQKAAAKILATVLSVRTLPVGKSALGELHGGSLEIRGLGFRALLLDQSSNGTCYLTLPQDSETYRLRSYYPDVQNEYRHGDIVVLRMATMCDGLYSLLIYFRSVSGRNNLYQRVGLLSSKDRHLEIPPEFFEEMTITVV